METVEDIVRGSKCGIKNFEKHRTAEERSRAFVAFCRRHHCGECPAHVAMNSCEFVWLDLEDEDNEGKEGTDGED